MLSRQESFSLVDFDGKAIETVLQPCRDISRIAEILMIVETFETV